MLIAVTRECPMRTRIGSSASGSDPLRPLFFPTSIPICGSSLISSIGMIKHFYTSNITGNRQGRRISHMSSCGTRLGIRSTVNITTTTGLFTFLRPLLYHFLKTLSYLYFGCKPGSN